MTQPSTIDIAIPGASATTYPIVVGQGILPCLHAHLPMDSYSQVFVVTDENVAPHWLAPLQRGCKGLSVSHLVLPAGEANKALAQAERVWVSMQEAGCDRRSLVLNLGGGVVGDIGGFAASTFMRGVDFVQLPTTLLAMVDASVGGKLGFNLAGIKNLIGVFQQPRAVLIDLATLDTLPHRELRSGLAEVLKHGLICDLNHFVEVCTMLQQVKADVSLITPDSWARVVLHSCRIKAAVVEADEREGGLRKILNFGHTAGHAIESLMLETPKPLLHGEAIALGMLVEAELSRLSGYIEDADVQAIEAGLQACGLPIRLPGELPASRLWQKMRGDKKNVAGDIHWSLLESMGKGSFDVCVDEALIQQSFGRIASHRRMDSVADAGGEHV